METVEIHSTKDQLNEFKESVLWHDIVTELEAWSEGFKREMMSIVDEAAKENPSTASVMLHMGDLNGRQKAVEYFLGLPDVFLSILETRNESSRGTESEPDN